MWLDCVLSNDLNNIIDVFYIALTETAYLVKLVNAWHYAPIINECVLEWSEKELNILKTTEERLMWQNVQHQFYIAIRLYILGSLFVIILAFNKP